MVKSSITAYIFLLDKLKKKNLSSHLNLIGIGNFLLKLDKKKSYPSFKYKKFNRLSISFTFFNSVFSLNKPRYNHGII